MNESNFALVEEHVLAQLEKIKTEKGPLILSEVANLNKDTDAPELKISKIYQAIKDLESECKEFEFPEYILLANHPELIVKLVYHRLLLWGKNTSLKLDEAWTLSLRRGCLIRQLEEAKALLPNFSYTDFRQGTHNVVYYDLAQKPKGTTNDDYWQMRTWQYQKIVEAVGVKLSHFAGTFRQCYTESESLIENIQDEINQLKFIFGNGKQLDSKALKAALFKIKALANSWLPEDEKNFLAEFKKFLSDGPDYSAFTVSNLNELCSRYRTTTKACYLTSPSLMGICLIRYGDWLESLRKGETKLSGKLTIDYSGLFQRTVNAALEEADVYEKSLKDQVTALIPSDNYKDYLLNELEQRRIAWNEADKLGYLKHMESKELLQSYFNLKCMLDNDPDVQTKALRASIKAEKETDALLDVLEEKYLDPVLMKSIEGVYRFQFEVVAMIHCMVPDSKLITRLWYAAATALSELGKDHKPQLFILNDLLETLYELYQTAEQRLDSHFQRLDGALTNEYITSVKRQFRAKFIQLQKPGNNLSGYVQQLKQLLDDEFELVRHNTKTVDISLLLQSSVSVPKEPAHEKESGPAAVAFLPKQSDFRGKSKSPVGFSDIRDAALFSKFEKELFDSEIIDADYNFRKKRGNKEMLAALYHILIQKNYFRNKNFKNGRNYDSWHYRQYLDDRYQVDTSQQFRKCSSKDIDGFKYKFTWIDNIAYCR